MTTADLIFKLKDQASPKPTAVGLTLPVLLLEAADALEANERKIAELTALVSEHKTQERAARIKMDCLSRTIEALRNKIASMK